VTIRILSGTFLAVRTYRSCRAKRIDRSSLFPCSSVQVHLRIVDVRQVRQLIRRGEGMLKASPRIAGLTHPDLPAAATQISSKPSPDVTRAAAYVVMPSSRSVMAAFVWAILARTACAAELSPPSEHDGAWLPPPPPDPWPLPPGAGVGAGVSPGT